MSKSGFSRVYREAVDEVVRLMPDDWSALEKHNRGWRPGFLNPRQYLIDSECRFRLAHRIIESTGAKEVLDVGGFLAAMPLALARLGFKVSIAEKFGYYGHALDGIAAHLVKNRVEVLDADFTDSTERLDSRREAFDAVTCMAVAEHLAHSPKGLMDNIRHVLKPAGDLVFEVPNLAFWPKRFMLFFMGKSVLSPIEDVYHSAVPFTGHHREYTLADAKYVVEQGGFSIVSEKMYNYAINTRSPWQLLKYAPAFLLKNWAGLIMLHCRKRAE